MANTVAPSLKITDPAGIPPGEVTVAVRATFLPKVEGLIEEIRAVEVTKTPVPLKATVCGLPVASLVIVNVPVRAPIAEGVNVTSIVQVVPAAKVAGLTGQLLVRLKSPVVAMLLATVSEVFPVLINVTG